MASILGGAQASRDGRLFKPFFRGVNAFLGERGMAPSPNQATHVVTFGVNDQSETAPPAGTIPMLCTPTIGGVAVTRNLIDGSAGLNVISVATFETLRLHWNQLRTSGAISGVTGGTVAPLGQVRLSVTFGTRDNYRTELVNFDMARVGLPYNAILGYPALAKFMAATHLGYNVVKMSGSNGTIWH